MAELAEIMESPPAMPGPYDVRSVDVLIWQGDDDYEGVSDQFRPRTVEAAAIHDLNLGRPTDIDPLQSEHSYRSMRDFRWPETWPGLMVSLSTDLLSIADASVLEADHIVAYAIQPDGLTPVNLGRGQPATGEILVIAPEQDAVMRMNHRRTRREAVTNAAGLVAIPTSTDSYSGGVLFAVLHDRVNLRDIEVRGQNVPLSVETSMVERTRTEFEDLVQNSLSIIVVSNRVVDLPVFDPLFEGGYVFEDNFGQPLEIAALPALPTNRETRAESETAGFCGIDSGPILVSLEPIDFESSSSGTLLHFHGDADVVFAHQNSALSSWGLVVAPAGEIYMMLEFGWGDAAAFSTPDIPISAGLDSLCDDLIVSPLR